MGSTLAKISKPALICLCCPTDRYECHDPTDGCNEMGTELGRLVLFACLHSVYPQNTRGIQLGSNDSRTGSYDPWIFCMHPELPPVHSQATWVWLQNLTSAMLLGVK